MAKPMSISVGDVFGELTVIEIMPTKVYPGRKHRMVKVRCSCGNDRVVQAGNLTTGNTKRCLKCAALSRAQKHRELHGYAPGEQARNFIFLNYQSNARQRGLDWELTFEQFCEVTAEDCWYCGAPPSNRTKDKNGPGYFVYSGIDRVDSRLGYLYRNVVPACIVCNRAKTNMSVADFAEWVDRLHERSELWRVPSTMPNLP